MKNKGQDEGRTCKYKMLKKTAEMVGHVKQREHVGRAMKLALPENSSRGRPKGRWLDCMANGMQPVGAVGRDVHHKECCRKMVPATVAPHGSGNS